MNRRIVFRVLGSSLLTLTVSVLPASGQTVEERTTTETYHSGPAAVPTAAPAPVIEHRSDTIEEHVAPPPPPPVQVEKRTYEEQVEKH